MLVLFGRRIKASALRPLPCVILELHLDLPIVAPEGYPLPLLLEVCGIAVFHLSRLTVDVALTTKAEASSICHLQLGFLATFEVVSVGCQRASCNDAHNQEGGGDRFPPRREERGRRSRGGISGFHNVVGKRNTSLSF